MSNAPDDAHLRWTELTRDTSLSTPVFSVVKSRRRSYDGRESDYFVIDSPDWANIIAITTNDEDERCFIMVRQFRQGALRVSLEFPGGVVDAGENAERGIVRELMEETGYVAPRVQLLGSVNPNPALMGNRAYTYFVDFTALSESDRRAARSQDLDENEIIDVELVPVESLIAGERDDEFDHAIMRSALSMYLQHVGSA
jgi:8-oxo-dGTP pyrophosphatase MutT (NUDIX family)